ncbi:MAG TPA: aminotransferase class III-fold pyridoxal phosphate-dependent enzyme [Steroidobacteraceae bacterium]|nr:aminotransferase class III-fold pyridoxal phosphate-dependent enzyme [Steroidobacteraceae bacterium]
MPSPSYPLASVKDTPLNPPTRPAGDCGRTARSAIEERYRRLTPRSERLMTEAATAMPGGNTRTTSFHPPYPVVIERGDGPWVFDVDQRRYLDLFCNGLSLIHGHNYAPVREAIQKTLPRGVAWSGASREQIAFAQLLKERVEAIELLRFTNSGSEAGMIAVKAARRLTGRPYIVKAVGAYHGSYPDLEAGLYGQGDLEGRALVAPFNDLPRYEQLMAKHGSEVAALVIEPVLVTGRVVPPEPGFLAGLEALARRYGALSILDDCLMLRLAVGGSAAKFDLQPDLVVLGKFLGGGTALGAFGGSREVMEIFDPTRRGAVFHGGSFNGNPIGCAAGLVTLRDLTSECIASMDAACLALRSALARRAAQLNLAVTLTGVGSVLGIAFTADPKRHEDDPSALGLASLFHLACANEGLLIGPGGILTVSTVHDEAAIAFAARGLAAAMGEIADFAGK